MLALLSWRSTGH